MHTDIDVGTYTYTDIHTYTHIYESIYVTCICECLEVSNYVIVREATGSTDSADYTVHGTDSSANDCVQHSTAKTRCALHVRYSEQNNVHI